MKAGTGWLGQRQPHEGKAARKEGTKKEVKNRILSNIGLTTDKKGKGKGMRMAAGRSQEGRRRSKAP